MKKLFIIITTTLLIVGICSVFAFAADEPKAPIKITNFGKMPAVTFKHSTHKKELKCQSCHHKEAKGTYKCGTAACHQAEAGKAVKLKDAAHKEKVGKCWSCHFAASPKVVKPLKCKDCHSKK
jgi:hypothetical protein